MLNHQCFQGMDQERTVVAMLARSVDILERSVGERNLRVDDLHAAFQTALKRALAPAPGQHLGFHH